MEKIKNTWPDPKAAPLVMEFALEARAMGRGCSLCSERMPGDSRMMLVSYMRRSRVRAFPYSPYNSCGDGSASYNRSIRVDNIFSICKDDSLGIGFESYIFQHADSAVRMAIDMGIRGRRSRAECRKIK